MSDLAMSGGDGFWARVRTALTRRSGEAEPAYGQAAIARARGGRTRGSQRVMDGLREAWALAAGRNVSLCAMALEIDRFPEFHAAYGPGAVEEAMDLFEEAIGGLLPRPVCRCIRTSNHGFMLLLPDMPLLMARTLAGKIAAAVRKCGVANRESHAGQVTLSVGLAVTNPQGKADRKVTEAAAQALRKAQRRGLARLEVVELRQSAAQTAKKAA